MKIRGLFAGMLVAVVLSGCARSATAPEIPRTTVAAPSLDEVPPPPDTTTANRGGGALGNGH